jgi:apoptosis-inducing factor 3
MTEQPPVQSGSQTSTAPPDLTKGIPSADLREGGMVVGLVGDEEVLVARVGGALFAVGALCTHYHGPLAKGLLVGETVRCPLHHARFCLRTGEALAAPAFDQLKCWEVREADGVIQIGSALTKTRTKPRSAVQRRPRRVVVLGGGGAGFAAVEMLRRDGFDGSLTMLSDDLDAPYDRPNCSKDYLAGEAPPEWMPLRDPSWYSDNDVDLRLGAEASSLDVAANAVLVKDGRGFDYDALVIATGAAPLRPQIPGFDSPDTYVLRSLRDTDAIIAAAGHARRVAVVGASFIGLEAAAALRSRGLEVHVAAPETIPLARVMGEDIGRWVHGLHERAGVTFHLGHGVAGWADRRLTLDDGTARLAEAAGLIVDRGIVVDSRLRTSAPGIYAAGDVARYPEPGTGKLIRVEHWVHAERQGQHVARMILGDDAPFNDPPYFWSAHPDAKIHYIGHAETFDPPTVDGSLERRDAEVRFASGGRLLALATVGRDHRSLQADVELAR